MKYPILTMAALVAVLQTGANAAPVISANEVVEICESGFAINTTNAASSSRKATCIAYLDAVIATTIQIGTLASPNEKRALFCLPQGTTYDQLAGSLIRFAKKNGAYGNRAAASVVMAAYADQYPCK